MAVRKETNAQLPSTVTQLSASLADVKMADLENAWEVS